MFWSSGFIWFEEDHVEKHQKTPNANIKSLRGNQSQRRQVAEQKERSSVNTII